MIAHRGQVLHGGEVRGVMLTGTTSWPSRAQRACRVCHDRGWLPPLREGGEIRRCPSCSNPGAQSTGALGRTSPYDLIQMVGLARWRNYRNWLR